MAVPGWDLRILRCNLILIGIHTPSPPLSPLLHESGVLNHPYDYDHFREDQTEASANEMGRIVAKLPMPPGCMTTLYGADQRFLYHHHLNHNQNNRHHHHLHLDQIYVQLLRMR